MLSCNQAIRKSCSGPVGGRSGAAFKVRCAVQGYGGNPHPSVARKRDPAPGYLPLKQSTPQSEGPRAESGQESFTDQQQAAGRASGMQRLHSSAGSNVSGQRGTSNLLIIDEDAQSGISRSRSETSFIKRLPRKAGFENVLSKLADERVTLQQDQERGLHRRSRNLSSAGSSMISRRSSCSGSSCPSQAVRSTVLDLELQIERERREEAEEELASLKAQLAAKNGGS